MFRFTIRDVLWLTVVAAIGAAWWADRASLAEWQLRESERQREAALLAVADMMKRIEAFDPALKNRLKISPEMDAAIQKARARKNE
jgi:hypothetical protein